MRCLFLLLELSPASATKRHDLPLPSGHSPWSTSSQSVCRSTWLGRCARAMISPGRWRCGYVATASLVPSLTAKRSFTLPSLCPQNTSSRRPLLARPLSSLSHPDRTL